MRCPVCRCLLASGNVCYNCGYGRREVKTVIPDDDCYPEDDYPEDEYPDDVCDCPEDDEDEE